MSTTTTAEKIKDMMSPPKCDALVERLEIAYGDALARVTREARAGRLTTAAEQRRAVERFRRDLTDSAIDLLPSDERAAFVLDAERQLRKVWPNLLPLSRLAPRRTPMQEFVDRARRQIASAARHATRTHAPEASPDGHARARERTSGPSRRRERASPDAKESEKPAGRRRGRGRRRWLP